jgi:hypothetical protein
VASGSGAIGSNPGGAAMVTDVNTYWSNTGLGGSAVLPPGPPGSLTLVGPARTMTGTIGGSLGIYPGQWWPKLTPLALVPSLTVGDAESSSSAGVKTTYDRVHDYVANEVWAGRKLEMALYQRYRYTTTGPDQGENASTTMLTNRIVYRPVFTSPITLRANYQGDRSLNDPALVTGDVGPWAAKQSEANELEWLMRWSQFITTRAKLKLGYEHTSNVVVTDATGKSTSADHTRYVYGGELQVRFYPLEDVSALFIYLSTEYRQHDQSGDGAYTAWEILPEGGVIWRLGDKLYLYAKLPLDYVHCLSTVGTACTTTSKFVPYLYFTMNL